MSATGDVSLKQRIGLQEMPRDWLNEQAMRFHYMHRPIHQRACPFGWAITFNGLPLKSKPPRVKKNKNGKVKARAGKVKLPKKGESLFRPDGTPCGFIVFASIHYTRLADEFGYPGLPTKWQVLSLARLWLHDDLPRNSETCVIAKALKLVQRRWLEVHPPKFLDEPYHILKIISYADTRYHAGTIYRAANFRSSGLTVSAKRHKNSRGEGMDGATLLRFVYDLPEPRWQWEPKGTQLSFEGVT
jgi:hypothetical protein